MGEEANLRLGDVNARLGLTMSAAFVTDTRGIAPEKRVRRAILFTESQFAAICRGLIAHVQGVQMLHDVRREPSEMEVANANG